MYELNENPPKRLPTNEANELEAEQHCVKVLEEPCCRCFRRKYSFPLWLILLWNILLFAVIVVVILLSPGVLKGKKAVTSNALDASAQADPRGSGECVSSTTEPATIQPATTIQTQSTTTKIPSTKGPDVECDVVIVGGGIDGLLLAYMLLVKKIETSVCIFEKENRLGGQIYDHFFSQASDIAVGLGHLVVLGNSNEESRVVQSVIDFGDLRRWARGLARVEARGVFEDNFNELRKRAFPALNRSDTVKDMADDVSKANASRYIIAGDFLTGYLSPEGRELLKDAYDLKYRLYDVNPESSLKFLKEKRLNEDARRFDHRPEKGLSELVRLLQDKVNQSNGRIYFQQTVTSVNQSGSTFFLQTTNWTVRATKTVLAVGPAALKDMEGDVIQNIISHKILKSIVSVPAFFGAAVYKDAWWKDIIAPNNMFISSSNCLGITMPYIRSKNGSSVLQTIANTGYCSVQWGSKLKISKDLVDREMKSALEYKFQRNISDALSTVYKYWENGFWYLQKAGTKFSLEEIRKWAKRPLPGSDVFLTGKAFYNFGGSLEDAFRSVNETLVEGWKTELKPQP